MSRGTDTIQYSTASGGSPISLSEYALSYIVIKGLLLFNIENLDAAPGESFGDTMLLLYL